MKVAAAAITAVSLLATPALAENFRPVTDRNEFVGLVSGKALKRIGIQLDVRSDGQIVGKAFGYPVTGTWDWNGGYFCRQMDWGGTEIPFNCQAVRVKGKTLRFTSDRGAGPYADLRLR